MGMKFKLNVSMLAFLLTFSAMSKSATDPVFPAGARSILTLDNNDPSEGVTSYSVHLMSGTNSVQKIATVTTNYMALATMGIPSGLYSFAVSAANINGESGLSTNITVRYWQNKPSQPKGHAIK